MTISQKVGVIILNYNGSKDTIECVSSVETIKPADYQLNIYVIDNASGSQDFQNLSLFMEKHKDCYLTGLKKNLGFTGGNNYAIKQALQDDCDYIFLLNNDTVINADTITDLLSAFKKDNKTGIAGAKIYFAKGCEYHKNRYKENEKGKILWYAGGIIDWNNIILSHRGVDEVDTGQYDRAEETDFVSGCAMMIKRAVFDSIGSFNDKYFIYLEDADLCQRARMAGYKLFYEPKSYLWHKNASSTGKPGSDIHVYYQTRNRLLFGFNYAPVRTKAALFKEAVIKSFNNKIIKQAFFDFLTGRLGKRL